MYTINENLRQPSQKHSLQNELKLDISSRTRLLNDAPSALSFSKTSALILADNSMRRIHFTRAICSQLCDRRYFYLNQPVARIRVIRLRLILTGEQREKGLINEECSPAGEMIFFYAFVNSPGLIVVDNCNGRTNSRRRDVPVSPGTRTSSKSR